MTAGTLGYRFSYSVMLWVVMTNISMTLLGCGGKGTSGRVTPDKFPECRIFHGVSKDGADVIDLESAATRNPNTFIEKGDPFVLVVSAIYVPTDYNWLRDNNVALILDMEFSANKRQTGIAVDYQTGVKANTALNFSNKTVLAVQSYDSSLSPYLRLRLIDVPGDFNATVSQYTDEITQAANGLANFYPNPFIPIFGHAMKIGGMLLSYGNGNHVIMDYEFQLYYHNSKQPSGTRLDVLQGGFFIAAGIPLKNTEHRDDFFPKDIKWDNKNKRLIKGNGEIIKVPVVAFQIDRRLSVVPASIMQNAANISKEISESSAGDITSSKVLESAQRLISSYSVLSSLRVHESNSSISSFEKLIESLRAANLTELDENSLFASLRYYTKNQYTFLSRSEWEQWWKDIGRKGVVDQSGYWMSSTNP